MPWWWIRTRTATAPGARIPRLRPTSRSRKNRIAPRPWLISRLSPLNRPSQLNQRNPPPLAVGPRTTPIVRKRAQRELHQS